jgi:succinate-semialdehyde dehydrogenase/glutarate-semialdehyde dehydrogenase
VVDEAVRAASAAAGWARPHPSDRAAAVSAWADRIAADVAALAGLQTAEGGKPLSDSAGGVEAGTGALREYAQLGPLHRGCSLQGGGRRPT